MFEFNNLINIDIKIINDSKIFFIENFFKQPDKIVEYLETNNPLFHKNDERYKTNYNNGTKFIDARHEITGPEIKNLYEKINLLIDQTIPENLTIGSNIFQMIDVEFNDYQNNFWFPHYDKGYTGIIYLNELTCAGTNLYEQVVEDYDNIAEHLIPWRSKTKYNVIYTIPNKYNQMVLFDGKKFKHGMAINDDIFFNEIRKNLVLFFIE
jgi:hypothetical protein